MLLSLSRCDSERVRPRLPGDALRIARASWRGAALSGRRCFVETANPTDFADRFRSSGAPHGALGGGAKRRFPAPLGTPLRGVPSGAVRALAPDSAHRCMHIMHCATLEFRLAVAVAVDRSPPAPFAIRVPCTLLTSRAALPAR
ncbi:hypothetical protein [Halomonas sp. AOP42-A1-14]|uniref:hypothetical protein n=1 Tax=Halomonas sp. AOP42-A1-14 TaxID=3457676 RepID=UPI0040340A0D